MTPRNKRNGLFIECVNFEKSTLSAVKNIKINREGRTKKLRFLPILEKKSPKTTAKKIAKLKYFLANFSKITSSYKHKYLTIIYK